MEMAEGKYTKRTSLDPTSPPVTETAEEALDVVIVANAIVTKEASMDPSIEEPFIVKDTANSSNYPSGNGEPIQGIRVEMIL